MNAAVAARMQGDDYQARWFWIQACRMFDDRPTVERVGYELALAKAFDDVVSFYAQPIVDERNDSVSIDCFQAKCHVNHAGTFTAAALTDPAFINASKVSLLERLRDAREAFEQTGRHGRFTIISPWGVAPDDPLAELVSTQGGEIRLHVLRRHEMRKVRALWREHLNVPDDAALEALLRPLRIRHSIGDMGLLRDLLDARLQAAGLQPVGEGRVGHPYDELIRKLLQRDVREFDREAVREIARREGLLRGRPEPTPGSIRLGIRSFMRFAEYMEDETDHMLSLVHHFDNRYVRDVLLWQTAIYPEIAQFLTTNVRPGGAFQFRFDCHTSIAFATGYSLGPKVGVGLSLIQKTSTGAAIWDISDIGFGGAPRGWSLREIGPSTGGRDTALALSVTHSVAQDVELYVRRELPSVGRIFGFTVGDKAGPAAIRDGVHALELARDLVTRVREERTVEERGGVLHIFGAMPNGLAFLLGREARVLGPCAVYEHDFDRVQPGSYLPGMQFPPAS